MGYLLITFGRQPSGKSDYYRLLDYGFTCKVLFNFEPVLVSDTILTFEFFVDGLLISTVPDTFECNGTNWQKIYRKNDLNRLDLFSFCFRVVDFLFDLFVVINPSTDFKNRLFDKDEFVNRRLGFFNKLKIAFDFDDAIDDDRSTSIREGDEADSDSVFPYG